MVQEVLHVRLLEVRVAPELLICGLLNVFNFGVLGGPPGQSIFSPRLLYMIEMGQIGRFFEVSRSPFLQACLFEVLLAITTGLRLSEAALLGRLIRF